MSLIHLLVVLLQFHLYFISVVRVDQRIVAFVVTTYGRRDRRDHCCASITTYVENGVYLDYPSVSG